MNKCVFLDRDGTIIHDRGYISKIKDVKLVAGAAEAIRNLNKAGYLVIVISNQSGIARGYFNEDVVSRINTEIQYRLNKKGAHIDAFYWCPHLPDGKIKKYAKKCKCRKPGIGMLLQAKKDFNIDFKKSYIVGDKIDDMGAGGAAKCAPILVLTGQGKKTRKKMLTLDMPNVIVKNLYFAVMEILK